MGKFAGGHHFESGGSDRAPKKQELSSEVEPAEVQQDLDELRRQLDEARTRRLAKYGIPYPPTAFEYDNRLIKQYVDKKTGEIQLIRRNSEGDIVAIYEPLSEQEYDQVSAEEVEKRAVGRAKLVRFEEDAAGDLVAIDSETGEQLVTGMILDNGPESYVTPESFSDIQFDDNTVYHDGYRKGEMNVYGEKTGELQAIVLRGEDIVDNPKDRKRAIIRADKRKALIRRINKGVRERAKARREAKREKEKRLKARQEMGDLDLVPDHLIGPHLRGEDITDSSLTSSRGVNIDLFEGGDVDEYI